MSESIIHPCFQADSAWRRGLLACSAHAGLSGSLRILHPPHGNAARFFGQIPYCTYHAAEFRHSQHLNTLSTTPSEEILPRVAAGEEGAMRRCIDRYGAIVWSIVRRYIKETADAEDLVQEVFTEIWKKSASFNPDVASEATFIGMVTRRRAIDFLRRQGRQPGFEPLESAASLPDPAEETSTISCHADAVKSSLAVLPSETRQLFDLFFENGFTHPEIAEKTGLPLGTVKTRLRRGLLTLRDHLRRAGISNTQTAS